MGISAHLSSKRWKASGRKGPVQLLLDTCCSTRCCCHSFIPKMDAIFTPASSNLTFYFWVSFQACSVFLPRWNCSTGELPSIRDALGAEPLTSAGVRMQHLWKAAWWKKPSAGRPSKPHLALTLRADEPQWQLCQANRSAWEKADRWPRYKEHKPWVCFLWYPARNAVLTVWSARSNMPFAVPTRSDISFRSAAEWHLLPQWQCFCLAKLGLDFS